MNFKGADLIYVLTAISLLCILSIYFCIKFALMLITLRDAIEDSLDIIDEKYYRISKILEIPVFFDSKEVKLALSDLEDARNALLAVANKLSKEELLEDEEVNANYYEEEEK